MATPETTLLTVALLTLGVVAYVYFGYPLVIWLSSRCFGEKLVRPVVDDNDLPTVTLLIAAYNEENDIRARLENALLSTYPKHKYDVVVASDGSTDRTNQIVAEYAHRGVALLAYPVRRGKAAVLNDSIRRVRGSIVLFSDANTSVNADAPNLLAPWFAQADVGVACGRLILNDPVEGRNVDGLYWKYETFLKKCESRLGALLGSNGGIYALRRRMYVPIPDNTLVDDFVIPLLARGEHRCRIIYDADAVATEETPPSLQSEFHRRSRIGAGGFQSIGILKSLLNPRHGWVSFTFWSHKVLRWTCPFFLVAGFVASLLATMSAFMAGNGLVSLLATSLVLAQVAFYALSMMAGSIPAHPRCLRILRLPAMFTMMNAALAVGFFRWLRGGQSGTWLRTARSGEFPAVAVPSVEPLYMASGMVAMASEGSAVEYDSGSCRGASS